MTLGGFPVDEVALNAIKHAMGGAYTVDPDGTHHLVGADFSFHQVLEFYSGYDPSKLVREEDIGGIEAYSYPEPVYHYTDVIRALIAEVERLRNDHPTAP